MQVVATCIAIVALVDPRATMLFFFNVTATTHIYTLSLHDALPISQTLTRNTAAAPSSRLGFVYVPHGAIMEDRKSTRLNSSHVEISYAVFCLKKKRRSMPTRTPRSHSCASTLTA